MQHAAAATPPPFPQHLPSLFLAHLFTTQLCSARLIFAHLPTPLAPSVEAVLQHLANFRRPPSLIFSDICPSASHLAYFAHTLLQSSPHPDLVLTLALSDCLRQLRIPLPLYSSSLAEEKALLLSTVESHGGARLAILTHPSPMFQYAAAHVPLAIDEAVLAVSSLVERGHLREAGRLYSRLPLATPPPPALVRAFEQDPSIDDARLWAAMALPAQLCPALVQACFHRHLHIADHVVLALPDAAALPPDWEALRVLHLHAQGHAVPAQALQAASARDERAAALFCELALTGHADATSAPAPVRQRMHIILQLGLSSSPVDLATEALERGRPDLAQALGWVETAHPLLLRADAAALRGEAPSFSPEEQDIVDAHDWGQAVRRAQQALPPFHSSLLALLEGWCAALDVPVPDSFVAPLDLVRHALATNTRQAVRFCLDCGLDPRLLCAHDLALLTEVEKLVPLLPGLTLLADLLRPGSVLSPPPLPRPWPLPTPAPPPPPTSEPRTLQGWLAADAGGPRSPQAESAYRAAISQCLPDDPRQVWTSLERLVPRRVALDFMQDFEAQIGPKELKRVAELVAHEILTGPDERLSADVLLALFAWCNRDAMVGPVTQTLRRLEGDERPPILKFVKRVKDWLGE